MAKREDSSGYCYHWIKANTSSGTKDEWYEEAFRTLVAILSEYKLRSGQALGHMYGTQGICFTETPISFRETDRSKYQPFGLEFYKSDIYMLGGKPVLNLQKDELNLIHPSLHWRYARHEPLLRTPAQPHGIDFTWERELRVNKSVIDLIGESPITVDSYKGNIDFAFVNIIVPNSFYYNKLLSALSQFLDNDLEIQRTTEKQEYYYWCAEFYEELKIEYRYLIKYI